MNTQLAAGSVTSDLDDVVAHRILILDFGSQYTQLIARRVREAGVYSEIYPWDVDAEEVEAFGADGIVLSGSPDIRETPTVHSCCKNMAEAAQIQGFAALGPF